MRRCTSPLALAFVLVLVVAVAGFAYSRVFAPDSRSSSESEQVGNVTLVESNDKARRPVVMPIIDWQPGEAWPGEWITYPADNQLPMGIRFEVAHGVVTSIAKNESDKRDDEILGTRYVVGDVDATDITPALWRSLDFEMRKPDGSIAELTVLRPLWWIEETGAKLGATVDLGMQELGISGMALVLKIGPCDVDSRDNPDGSQIVTGTIKHRNAEVWDLVFNSDSSKPLGVTANHPIYSADRNDWVAAGELRINEKVRTLDGTAALTSKSQRPGRHTVYNLEVHRHHTYYVSQFGILAHNSNILNCTITPKKLQHEFKHASHFGISGNWNKQTGKAFHDAIQTHVGRTDIQKIAGTFRGTIKVTHHFDPATRLNVMVDEAGNFVGGWRLGPEQLDNLLRIGNVQ